jgi:hypothetical protein
VTQSSAVLVEPRAKQGGPSPKAKYSPATDSEPVRRLKGEKNPVEGSEKYLKPCAYKLSEPYAPGNGERVTAYLLHNGPAS